MQQISEKYKNEINILGDFCGIRDVPELTGTELKRKYGFEKADVMVLFGGSILCGGDVLAKAMKNNVAEKYIIVGGAGHTTPMLRDKMHEIFQDWDTMELSEAELFKEYLQRKYSLQVDYIEEKSSNCGNNITLLLKLIKDNGVKCNSIILCQDATMQRRMDAALRKYHNDWMIINYAAYQVHVINSMGKLIYENMPVGMWDMERYVTLLMGEIPRLTDDKDGYGPNGTGFIFHVDVPDDVANAFIALKEKNNDFVREANPEFKDSL